MRMELRMEVRKVSDDEEKGSDDHGMKQSEMFCTNNTSSVCLPYVQCKERGKMKKKILTSTNTKSSTHRYILQHCSCDTQQRENLYFAVLLRNCSTQVTFFHPREKKANGEYHALLGGHALNTASSKNLSDKIKMLIINHGKVF